MAFGGGSSQDLTIKVRVDESGTIQILNQVGDAVKKVADNADNSSGAFSNFGASIITINQGAQLAISAINTLGSSLSAIPAAIQAASRISDIFSAFDTAAQKAGTFGDVLTTQLQTAVDGTVSKIDLLKNSNELLQAGLKPDQIVDLTSATRSFADVLGTDTKGALDAVTDSLLKGNDRALKALGITVDNEAAARSYAAAHGVLVEKLTETQKVEATRNAVIEAMIAKEKELGKATLDSGDAIDRITATITNFATEALKAIGDNKNLALALNEVATELANVDFQPFIDAVTDATNFTADFIRGLKELSKWIPSFKQISDGARVAAGDYSVFQEKLDDAAKAIEKQTDPAQFLGSILGELGGRIQEAAVGANLFGGALNNKTVPAVQKTGDSATHAAKEIKSFQDQLSKELAQINEQDLRDSIKRSIDGLNASDFSSLYRELYDLTYGSTYEGYKQAVEKGIISPDQARRFATVYAENATKPFAEDWVKQLTEANTKATDDLGRQLEETAKNYTQFFQGIFSEFASTGSIDFKKRLENAGIEFVSGLAGEMAAQLGGDFLTGLLDPSGLGKQLADSLLGALTGGLTGGGGGGLGGLVDDFLGAFGFARGGIFDGSKVIKAARGMVINRPTNFAHAGGIGLMGEAGPEAILPLTRVNGRLGVSAVMSRGDEIGRISQDLSALPGSRSIDITLNVDAVYGPGTEDILRAAGIDLTRYGTSGDAPGLPPVRSQRLQARRLANGRYAR